MVLRLNSVDSSRCIRYVPNGYHILPLFQSCDAETPIGIDNRPTPIFCLYGRTNERFVRVFVNHTSFDVGGHG